jgi:hypothetical protein
VRLAESLGWPVADLADGSRDAVLIYHVEPLTRRPIELEQFLDYLASQDSLRALDFRVALAPIDCRLRTLPWCRTRACVLRGHSVGR